MLWFTPCYRARDVAHGGDAFLRLHGACDAFDRSLAPYLMRWIVPAACQVLSGDQPIDGFPRFRGKGLRTLDFGCEPLELSDVLDAPAGRAHENSNKSNGEHGGVAPAQPQRTVVGGDACAGGPGAPPCARGGRELLRGESHVRLLIAGG